MMIQEMVNTEVFPDPKTRPNYMIGTFTHNILTRVKSRGYSSSDYLSDPLDFLIEQYVFEEKGWIGGEDEINLHSEAPAKLTLSPVVRFPEESEKEYKERQKSSMYLTDTLLSAKKHLNTEYIASADRHRRIRWLRTASQAVVFPMTVMFNCHNRGVLDPDPTRRNVFKQLVAEAAAIIAYDDKTVTAEYLENHIADLVMQAEGNLSPLLVRIARGKETSIEVCLQILS